MKERWKRLMSYSLFVFLVFSGFLGLTAEEPPLEVVQAAQKGICALPSPHLEKASQEGAFIHHGFQVYTAAPMQLVNSPDLAPIITPTGLWRFVLENNGMPTALITVARVNGQWTAVSRGGARLAVEVNTVLNKWPAKDGYSHRFLRVYQARADFIEISMKNRSLGFVPLTASRLAFGLKGPFDAEALLHPSEVLKPLQRLVKEKMLGFSER